MMIKIRLISESDIDRSSWMDSICRISFSSVRFSSADSINSTLSLLSADPGGTVENDGSDSTAAASPV